MFRYFFLSHTEQTDLTPMIILEKAVFLGLETDVAIFLGQKVT